MKCPNCGGMCEFTEFDGLRKVYFKRKCEVCNGTGEVEMTNEDWLRSLNTEQLADAFFEYRYTYATPRQKLWMSASEECIKTDIVEWLKQPHNSPK